MLNDVKTVVKISADLLEKINHVMKEEDPIRYYIGIKLENHREDAMYVSTYIDWDIATGDMFGFHNDYKGNIVVERIPYKRVLGRA